METQQLSTEDRDELELLIYFTALLDALKYFYPEGDQRTSDLIEEIKKKHGIE